MGKESFSSLHTINKPCKLKQVKITKIRLNFEKLVFYFEAVWLWIWGRIVSQETILIFKAKKVEFFQQFAFFNLRLLIIVYVFLGGKNITQGGNIWVKWQFKLGSEIKFASPEIPYHVTLY